MKLVHCSGNVREFVELCSGFSDAFEVKVSVH